MATCLLVTIFSAAICVQLSLAQSPDCASVKCNPYYECKDSKCVPMTKKGNCPSISYSNEIKRARCPTNCKSDLDCPSVQKCCPKPGCSFTCQNPEGPPCEENKCPRGEKCITKIVVCFKAPCDPIPTCVPIE